MIGPTVTGEPGRLPSTAAPVAAPVRQELDHERMEHYARRAGERFTVEAAHGYTSARRHR